jgi:predicted transcriptional regulator
MEEIQLTTRQRSILTTLIAVYDHRDGPVKASTLARELDKCPGSIRNTMQGLKSLKLVDGVPGPSGGYMPTARAFRQHDKTPGVDTDTETVPVRTAGRALADVAATSITFPSVPDPDQSRVEVQFAGTVPELGPEDPLTIGPVPYTGMVVEGLLVGVEKNERILVCEVESVDVVDVPT